MRRHHQRPALTEPLVQMLDKLLLGRIFCCWMNPPPGWMRSARSSLSSICTSGSVSAGRWWWRRIVCRFWTWLTASSSRLTLPPGKPRSALIDDGVQPHFLLAHKLQRAAVDQRLMDFLVCRQRITHQDVVAYGAEEQPRLLAEQILLSIILTRPTCAAICSCSASRRGCSSAPYATTS